MRAFLSHSSLDKEHYVAKVAAKLGKDRIVYDEMTFEEGLMSIEEIDRGLEISDVFVVFLSENSINSDWVKYELFRANELLKDKSKLKRIYPLIIDARIKYNDARIPEWLYENNLQFVISSNKATSLILQRLREISYLEHPVLEEKNNIFVGRHDIMKGIEVRINDFEKNIPFAFCASGSFQNIGRKKVMFHSLLKSDAIKSSYRPPIIELGAHESIEDFILKIDDLGLTSAVEKKGLMQKSMKEKIDIVYNQMVQIRDENQRIFIEDKGAIVHHNREIVDWFLSLYEKMSNLNYLVIGIASLYRPRDIYKIRFEDILFTHIPELDIEERGVLFNRYLQIEKVNISRDDFRLFSKLLSGFPEQAYYAVRLIKELGLTEAKRNTNLIVEFNTERVIKLMNDYDGSNSASGILALLAQYGAIGLNTLYDIVGDSIDINSILEGLFAKGICETFGLNKEYIRLNDIVYDYLIRTNMEIPAEYQQKVAQSLNDFLENKDEDDYFIDILNQQFLIKKAIIDKKIDAVEDLLIPSHFLHSMKELYDKHKNYDDVIILADRILQKGLIIDKYINNEIRYYLCMSLARTKSDRFKDEVQTVEGADHDFLFGFYYRQIGRTENAIERYKSALVKRNPFARAQRELVQVYLMTEDYEKAYKLAKENYESDNKKNPYHIHAYFSCLLRVSQTDEDNKAEVLARLIRELEIIKHENAKEFFLRCKAQYAALIENSEEEARRIIDSAIEEMPNNHWVLADKFHIHAKFGNSKEMENVLTRYSEKFSDKQINHKNNLIKFQILISAVNNQHDRIPQLINRLKFYPKESIEKMIEKYSSAFSETATSIE